MPVGQSTGAGDEAIGCGSGSGTKVLDSQSTAVQGRKQSQYSWGRLGAGCARRESDARNSDHRTVPPQSGQHVRVLREANRNASHLGPIRTGKHEEPPLMIERLATGSRLALARRPLISACPKIPGGLLYRP